MSLETFLTRINQGETISFQDTIAVIAEHYDYQPAEFSNGFGEDALVNAPGTNEGSCKIFAFAHLNGLSEPQTLALFGDYYRKDVLEHPDGTDHKNIRNFMKYGWRGVNFSNGQLCLQAK